MFCSNCGNELLEDTKFCPSCGDAVNPTSDTTMPNSDGSDPMQTSVPISSTPKRSKKGVIWFFIIAIFIITIVVLLLKIPSVNQSFDNSEISMVKNGILEAYPQKTVGDAFEDFMIDVTWECITADDGKTYVNVSGDISYFEKNVRALVQFRINAGKETFEFNAMEFNGVPQDRSIYIDLLDAMYFGTGVSEGTYIQADEATIQLVDEPQITMTLSDLAEEYRLNQIVANAKYGGELMVVTGIVGGVFEDGSLFIEGDSILTSMTCNFEDANQLMDIKAGDYVSVKGRYSEDYRYVLDYCEFVD